MSFISYQVYVILAERDEFVAPIACALLPNKNENSYTKMLRLIGNAWAQLMATRYGFQKSDDERGKGVFFAQNASRRVFFFHLIRNVKKRPVREGLMSRHLGLK